MLVTLEEKTTEPVKLLTGVAVMVPDGIEPPAATLTVGVAVEIVKSGQEVLVITTSTGAVFVDPFAVCEPAPVVRAGPLEP